jgi:DNA modification methylase
MKPYAQTDNYTLYLGDAWQVLDSLPENSVDAVVTDPPYEIGFMNKGWDNTGVAFNRTTWEKVLRVLKPGGHLLAFNHSRTFHRMAVAIEDAGFEIRDTIMWLYGSGFPKSHDISKAIDRKSIQNMC